MGGKSKAQTVGYHYRPAFHVGLVGRMIDAFLEYRAADKTAWAGELTASGRIQIDAPDLFGGEKDQGGIVGPVDVMFGEPDQVPNPYLVEVFGAQTVAWRGMTTLAFCGGRFGAMNPYQQKSAYKIRKILNGWDGEAWYPERAQVPLVPETLLTADLAFPATSASQGPYAGITFNTGFTAQDVVVVEKPPGLTYQAYSVWDTDDDPRAGGRPWTNSFWVTDDNDRTSFFWGAGSDGDSDRPDRYASREAAEAAVAGRYVGLTGSTSYTFWINDTPVSDNRGGLSLRVYKGGLLGINPAHLLYYVRTDPEKGAEPRANINEASLRAAADRLHDEGFGLCQVVYDPQQDTPDSMTERICRIIGGSFERSLIDGQWYLDLARGDYDLESLPVMSDDDILEIKRQPSTLHGVTNSLSVRYFDPIRKESVITPALRALGLIRAFGEIHETLDFPEIADAATALKVADRELRARITPTEAMQLASRPRLDLLALRRSQYFRLQSPKHGIADMVCIVGEKDVGTLRSGAVSWKVTQHIYSLAQTVYAEVEKGVDTRPDPRARPITEARAFEAPYINVVGALPRAELEALPDDVGFLQAVAASPGGGLDYTLKVAAEGGDYETVATGEWCPTAIINEAAGFEEREFTFSAGRGLGQVVIGAPVLWGDEIGRVDEIDIATGTVEIARGCADTVPQEHVAGERVWFLVDGATADDVTEYAEGEEVGAKLLQNTGSQQYPLEIAIALPLTFGGRAARPYAPAGLLINGNPDPGPDDPLDGIVEVEWVHRDRELQADQLFDTTAPSIGPKPGTTVTVEYWTEDGSVLVGSESGIIGMAATPWEPPTEGRYRIDVFSVLDGLDSWQKHQRIVLVGAELWTPHMLEDAPKIWLDWDSPVTDESGFASAWGNQGTLGAGAVQDTPSLRPGIVPGGVGDRRYLHFDNAGMTLSGALSLFRNIPSAWTFYVVRKRGVDSSSSTRQILFATSGVNNGRFADGFYVAANAHAMGRRRLDNVGAQNLVGSARPGWVIRRSETDYAAAAARLYLDGSLNASSSAFLTPGNTSNTDSTQAPSVGAELPLGVAFGDIDLALVMIGTGTLPTEAEWQRLEGWAAHRCGLQSNLQDDHPFRIVAPYANTPMLQPSFEMDPVVIGFVSDADGGDVGVSAGPAVASEFGILLNSEPALLAGQGVTVTSDGTDIAVRLDDLTPPAVPAQAVVMDHKGQVLVEIPLTDHSGYFGGDAAGAIEDGGVYYIRIEEI